LVWLSLKLFMPIWAAISFFPSFLVFYISFNQIIDCHQICQKRSLWITQSSPRFVWFCKIFACGLNWYYNIFLSSIITLKIFVFSSRFLGLKQFSLYGLYHFQISDTTKLRMLHSAGMQLSVPDTECQYPETCPRCAANVVFMSLHSNCASFLY